MLKADVLLINPARRPRFKFPADGLRNAIRQPRPLARGEGNGMLRDICSRLGVAARSGRAFLGVGLGKQMTRGTANDTEMTSQRTAVGASPNGLVFHYTHPGPDD